MRRREFIGLVGGVAAWPVVAPAQQSRPASRLGILSSTTNRSLESVVRQGLSDIGYVEGQNLIVEYRSSGGKADRLAGLAAELTAARVDVIFAGGSEATQAAQRETKTIPIVMTSTNPVALGFVASLARPGGNITGLSLLGPEASGKRLEIFKELIPGLSKVSVFWNPNDPGAEFSLKEVEAAGEKLRISLHIVEIREIDAFIDAFPAAAKAESEAVVLVPAPLMNRNAEQIAALALKSGLPTMNYSGDSVKAGMLVSYGPDLSAIYRRAAYFIDRILKGESPANLPVEQPTKFELVINIKTAKQLGIEVPPTLLGRADAVIE
jgi:putative tryptophan/tyrosine transport system substrate-binding protein